jgi:hypothetical protein
VLVELVEQEQLHQVYLEYKVVLQFLIQLHPQVVEAEEQMQDLVVVLRAEKDIPEDQAAVEPAAPPPVVVLELVEQEMIQ